MSEIRPRGCEVRGSKPCAQTPKGKGQRSGGKDSNSEKPSVYAVGAWNPGTVSLLGTVLGGCLGPRK